MQLGVVMAPDWGGRCSAPDRVSNRFFVGVLLAESTHAHSVGRRGQAQLLLLAQRARPGRLLGPAPYAGHLETESALIDMDQLALHKRRQTAIGP